VLSDILLALDSGNLVMLTLLDLSAAFDSIDHHTLLQRLRKSYGLKTGKSSTGLRRISATEFSMSALRRPARRQRQLSMEYHRAQSLDRSCFSCTLPIYCSSLNVIISRHTDTQTTPKSTGTVNHLKLVVSYSRSLSALTRFQRG